MANDLNRVGEYLRTMEADEETLEAFSRIRDTYTKIIGMLMLMGCKTGPEFEDDEPEVFPEAAIELWAGGEKISEEKEDL